MIGKKGFQKGHPSYLTKQSIAIIASKTSERQKGKRPEWLKGFEKGHGSLRTEESYRLAAQKTSKALTGRPQYHQRGSKSHLWKGGITKINAQIRTSIEYKNWRRAVFERDDYTCQACGIRGKKLNADHVMPFALYQDLRFEVLNGRTLCLGCHKKTDTYLKGKVKMYATY